MKESLEQTEKFAGEGKEEEKPLKRVFVEVGTHYLPIPFMGSKNFADDELYIGIEKSNKLVKEAKKNAERAYQRKKNNLENIHFLQADAERLPIKNEIAEEVFLGNVLGDPSISLISKEKFLEEAKRIVKKDGVIVVKETNTPLNHDVLMKLFIDHNLQIMKEVKKSSSEEWAGASDPYQKIYVNDLQISSRNSYIVYAKEKIKKE